MDDMKWLKTFRKVIRLDGKYIALSSSSLNAPEKCFSAKFRKQMQYVAPWMINNIKMKNCFIPNESKREIHAIR